MTIPSPAEVKERTAPHSIFQRERKLTIHGVEFKLRRMTLREELGWYALRDSIFRDSNVDEQEKVVRVWEELLKRVVVEPKLSSYTEELPTTVIARLIEEITRIHLWDMDFPTSRQG